jgi:D-alanine-D-alanine ligase
MISQVEYLLLTYREPVLIEKYLPGAEYTVAILGNDDRARCLPIVGMKFDELPEGAPPIYGYEAKWIWDTREKPLDIFKCPAPIPGVLQAKIEGLVARACSVLRIRDWCRVDVRLDEKGEPNILEANPLPGILPRPEDNSCLPKAARTAGYSYSDLIHRVVEEASKRCGLRQTRIRPATSDRPAVLADRA